MSSSATRPAAAAVMEQRLAGAAMLMLRGLLLGTLAAFCGAIALSFWRAYGG